METNTRSTASSPMISALANATDAHIHIYDSRFPAAPGAALRPPDATVDDYRTVQQRLGLSRVVIVQPSTYGADNSCALDAIAKFGRDIARAVAVVDLSVTDDELERLDRSNVRAIRFNLFHGAAANATTIEPLSKRIAHLGWHVQIHMSADQIAQSADLFDRIVCPLVFDHRARIPPEIGTKHPAFSVVRRLLDAGRTWVKLSSAYQDSKIGAPTYADIGPVSRAFVAAAPERMLWGTDWPHPTEKADAKPDAAVLYDLLADWTTDEAARKRILVDNPAALFGFGK